MSRLNLSTIASLQNETTALSSINSNFTQIQAIVDTLLSRLGTSPNAMDNLLDMNNYRIINLPEPSSEAEPVRLADLAEFTETGEITINITGTTGYTNVAALEAATISAPVLYTYLEGYYESGDCGTPIYLTRIGDTEPTTHSAYFESADGDFWLITNAELELKMFGAKGDGTTDDTDAANAWLRSSSALQRKSVALIPGTYMCGGYQLVEGNTVIEENRVFVNGCRDLDVRCGNTVVFKAITQTDPEKTQKMFAFDSEIDPTGNVDPVDDAYPRTTFWGTTDTWTVRPRASWVGGTFDTSGLAWGATSGHTAWDKASGGGRGSALGFTRFAHVYLENIRIIGGSDFFDEDGHYVDQTVIGGDNGVTFIRCQHMTVVGCFVMGMPDSAFYPRTDNEFGMPGVFTMMGCHIYRCYTASNAKHNGGRFIAIGNSIIDVSEGITLSGNYNETVYQPFDVLIVGNRFQYMSRYAMDIDRAERGIVSSNSFADWGYNRDGTNNTTVGRPYISLIRLRGCRNVIVSSNTASMIDWDGDTFLEFGLTEGSSPAIDVEDGGYTQLSYNCVWTNNIVEGRPITSTGERTSASGRIGIGVMCRDRSSDEGSNYYIDNVARNIVTQIYIFANAQHVRLAPNNVAYPAP